MTGKFSAAFGAGLVPELRSDSAPHQGGQARSGCSSEGISRQEDGRDVTNSRICPSRIRMQLLTSINKMHFALAFIGRNSAYKVTLKEGTERKMSG